MREDVDLCPECEAKWEAAADKLDAHVRAMAGELEDWQVVAALIAAAGSFARQRGIPAEEVMSEVRGMLISLFDVTICRVEVERPVREWVHPEGEA